MTSATSELYLCTCARCGYHWPTDIKYPEYCARCSSPHWFTAWEGEYLQRWPVVTFLKENGQYILELKTEHEKIRIHSKNFDSAHVAIHSTLPPNLKRVKFPDRK